MKKGIDGEEVCQNAKKDLVTTVSYFEDILCSKAVVHLMIQVALMNTVAKAMATEMEKARPRDQVLLPLLKSTYDSRRMYVEFDDEVMFALPYKRIVPCVVLLQ